MEFCMSAMHVVLATALHAAYLPWGTASGRVPQPVQAALGSAGPHWVCAAVRRRSLYSSADWRRRQNFPILGFQKILAVDLAESTTAACVGPHLGGIVISVPSGSRGVVTQSCLPWWLVACICVAVHCRDRHPASTAAGRSNRRQTHEPDFYCSRFGEVVLALSVRRSTAVEMTWWDSRATAIILGRSGLL